MISLSGIQTFHQLGMELMVPESSRDYAEKALFVSLYINNIYLYRLLKESTTCFPDNNKLINNNYYKEIQPPNITVGLTVQLEKSPSKSAYSYKLSKVTQKCLKTLDTTVIRG